MTRYENFRDEVSEKEIRELRIINQNLEQDLAAMHELFRKVTGYTAVEYAMMRESLKEGS